ncbi:hypothetical protein N7495_000031 [Penicillium taxi]|uniref:uncharacterized protein n=1 Tax=Penicillium taxi TaxID=168475 RepID=UPI0025456FC8|nr:uncharacterized protein N7495_000031 [Penicillium taxi]KAJ5907349.1 hypothetical protein N7495_000031 [Penicillium taxi]
MAMTQAGTVIFPLLQGFEYVVIDNQTYQDGCLLLLNFAINGQVAHQARMLPYRLGRLKSIRHGLGHLWSELFDMPDVNPRWNQPIDLQPPLLEILATISQRGDLEHLNDYTLAEWTEELEWFAPEYLAYEREGRVAEYSWDQLAGVTDSGYNHIRDRRLMIAMGMRPV